MQSILTYLFFVVVLAGCGNSSAPSNTPYTALVLGQPSPTQILNYQRGMSGPTGGVVIGSQLFIADALTNRVLVWNAIPTTVDKAADVVIGQVDMSHNGYNQDPSNGFGTIGQSTLAFPSQVACAAGKVVISDAYNHRLLVYNAVPAANNANADLVIGQPNFTSHASSTTASTFGGTGGAFTDGTALLATDWASNRILGWSAFPAANGAAADSVFGQADFISGTAPRVPSLTNVYEPMAITGTSQFLMVADAFQYRVLMVLR